MNRKRHIRYTKIRIHHGMIPDEPPLLRCVRFQYVHVPNLPSPDNNIVFWIRIYLQMNIQVTSYRKLQEERCRILLRSAQFNTTLGYSISVESSCENYPVSEVPWCDVDDDDGSAIPVTSSRMWPTLGHLQLPATRALNHRLGWCRPWVNADSRRSSDVTRQAMLVHVTRGHAPALTAQVPGVKSGPESCNMNY